MGIINRNRPAPNQCAAKVTDELFVITDLLVFLYLLKMFPFGANSCPSIRNCKRKQWHDPTRADWQHGLVTGPKSRFKTRAKNSEESFAERKMSPLWVGNAFYFQAFRVITRQLDTGNQLKKHEKRKMVNSPFNYAELHLQGRTCRKKAAALVSLQTFYFFQVVKEVPPNCLHLQRVTEVKWSADSYRLIY